ncbi:MAG: nucleotidyltransferase family protein [Fibrobacter sp.]|nr:nucleotidyltransferase family protein [Fibrobacter sp.]
MQQSIIDIFFALLRYSLDVVPPQASSELSSRAPARDLPFVEPLSDDDWKRIFAISKKQALIGVIYSAVQRLPQDLQPPKELMDKWNQNVRQIIIRNTRMNATAAQLTQMFEEKGRKTVILKGQANALLYPEPLLRQAGDIDILVQGGRSSVLKLLKEMGVMEGAEDCIHHVHLGPKAFGKVPVEVHYLPTFSKSPFSHRRLQTFLAKELAKPGAVTLSKDGFYVPSASYALVMQLSHIFKHYYHEGIGLRQLVDYYLLLSHSTQADRDLVASNLKYLGLNHIAGAVMWIMAKLFELPENHMLCKPDDRRGILLLEHVLEGGNFGQYSGNFVAAQPGNELKRWLMHRIRPLKLLDFDFAESFWVEADDGWGFVKKLPRRILLVIASVAKQSKQSLHHIL